MDIPVGADEVVLYRFDNGATISRILGPNALLKHTGSLIDLPSLQDGRYVQLALKVPIQDDPDVDSVSIVLGSPRAASPRMWNHLVPLVDQRDLEHEWSWPYWMEFAEEVLIPDGQIPQGNWAREFPTPFWVDDSLWERTSDSRSQMFEKKLQDAWKALEQSKGQARESAVDQIDEISGAYIRYAFGPLLIDQAVTDVSELWISFAPRGWVVDPGTPSLNYETLKVLPSFVHGKWFMITDHDGMASGRGDTLSQAISTMCYGQVLFHFIGCPMPASMCDEWLVHETEGGPTFDSQVLEAYFLLGQDSPLLWPQANFEAWWRSL